MKKIFMLMSVLATVSVAWATNTISISFGEDRVAVASDTTPHGLVEVPGSAWLHLSGKNGTASGATIYEIETGNTTANETLGVSWAGSGVWNWGGVPDRVMDGYLDDNGARATISFANVPFAKCDVLVYFNSDNGGNAFAPIAVNDVLYTWDAEKGEVRLAADKTDTWGATCQDGVMAYGTNVIRVNGVVPMGMLSLRTADRSASRGSIAAVQLIEVAGGLPPPDFTWSGVPGEAPAGWGLTTLGQLNPHYQRLGPGGISVLSIGAGRAPYGSQVQLPETFTCSVLLDIADVDGGDKDASLIDFGSSLQGNNTLRLLKLKGTDNVQLAYAQVSPNAKDTYDTILDAVTVENVTPGYHLYTFSFSTWGRMTLRLDDGAVQESLSESHGALAAGFQFGDVYGGALTSASADNLGIYNVRIWNTELTQDQKDMLWEMNKDAAVQPVLYPESKNLTTWPATGNTITLDVPSLQDAGTHWLGANCGTLNIRARSEVALSALSLLNNGATDNNLVVNIGGTVTITASNETSNVYAERYVEAHDRGILTGHWHGTGTYNITGAVVGENAYWETVYTAEAQRININGGQVRVRGLCAKADNGNSQITLTNGGLLEFADLAFGTIPFNLGAGTVRVSQWGDSEGWTNPARVTFTDAENPTTLDPNGLSMTFSGLAGGAGAVTVADSSANADGTVTFASINEMSGTITLTGATTVRAGAANGFSGTFDVQDAATLDLGTSRPEGVVAFAEGTTVVLRESLADENGVVAIAFTGAPNVVMYRADGVTPIEDARVETVAGEPRIVYTALDVPMVSGVACWYDFEFENRSYQSEGSNTGSLVREGNHGIGAYAGRAEDDFVDDHALFTAAQCYMTIAYPAQWSAAIYATVPQRPGSVVMAFGTLAGGVIGLVGGEKENEVLLVRTTGNVPYEVLAAMTVPNAATTQHLYVFSKRNRTIDIYLDGILWNSYASTTDITLGAGFQIGSVHGTTGGTGLERFGVENFYATPADFTMENAPAELLASYIGMLRLYDTALNSAALAALAAEFPYVSPNGLYARDLAGAGAESWTGDGLWQQVSESGTIPADEPQAGAMLQINGAAAGSSSLTVGLAADQHFEAVTLGGAGAVTLKKGGTGLLVNDGKTTVNTAVTIEYGAASIAGGPLVMGANGSVNFDYRNYPLSHTTANQSIVLTGNSSADAAVTFQGPTETYGRTLTFRFNEETSQWQLDIAREPFALDWIGGDAGAWNDAALWRTVAEGADAGFIAGDAVFFGDALGGTTATVAIDQDYAPAAINFSGRATAYSLTGAGVLTTASLVKSGEGAVDVANTIQLTGTPALSIASGAAAFHDLRGTVASAAITYGSGNVLFGTAGDLSLASVTAGAGRSLVIEAAAGGTVTSPAEGDLLALAGVSLSKTGAGTLRFPAGNSSFAGRLLVEDGTVLVGGIGLPGLTATRDLPIEVSGAGVLKIENVPGRRNGQAEGVTADSAVTLPKAAVVVARDGGRFVVNDNNPFNRNEGAGPTLCAVDGGVLEFVGASDQNDIRVERIELDSGSVAFTGEIANWSTRGVYVTGGKLVSAGESSIRADVGCPNRLDVATIEVTSGKLTLDAPCEQTIVKTGAGVLELVGGAQTGVVDVQAGGLKATETTAANNTTLRLASGTTLDLSALTGPFGGEDLSVVYAEDNAFVTINLGDRAVENDELLVAWGADGAQTGRYRCLRASGAGMIRAKADGLHFAFSGFTLILR